MPDQSAPFPGLKVWERLEYKLCPAPNHTRFASKDSMVKHLRKAHPKGEFREVRYRLVPSQTWFPNYHGGLGVWWLVTVTKKRRVPDGEPVAAIPPQPVPDLHTERHLVGTQSKDDENPYLKLAAWPEAFYRRRYPRAIC